MSNDNNIKVGLTLETTNIKETVAATDKIAANLKRAGEAASKVKAPILAGMAKQATSPGSRGASNSKDSGTARGLGGLTGASGRDFAAQSQGLGGLVHVYATFAANLFAVSAAFTALSKAADTSNMIKGLDQLGAATGRPLASIAVNLRNVTDGAISMREALNATALASAGGLSAKDIVRLGDVAKKTSLALGRDLPDSIDRLTKGIVKNQPELLDELGIMTKLIPAQQAYALANGKTLASLSDLEKRQAFANAVLAEGERKFGDIALAANPYSKILASTSDILFSVLDKVNKVLGPLLTLLSQSPTALLAVLAGIGTVLLKQAIPALGAYRANVKKVAEESTSRLKKLYEDQSTLAIESANRSAAAARVAFSVQVDTQKKIKDLQDSANEAKIGKGRTIDYPGIARKNALEVTEQELKQLDNRANYLAKKNTTIATAESSFIKAHLLEIRSLKAEALAVEDAAAEKKLDKDARRFTHQSQLEKSYNDAVRKASRDRILASVAETAATVGPTRAFAQLRSELDKEAGGRFVKGIAGIKGALTIATSAVSTFLGAFGNWIMFIGLAVQGLTLLVDWLSNNNKEYAKFTDSIETSTQAIKLSNDVIDKFTNRKNSGSLKTEDIIAQKNALGNLTDAISAQIDAYEKLKDATKGMDVVFDTLWSVINKGSGNKLADSLTQQVSTAFKLVDTDAARKELLTTLGSILNIPENKVSIKSITEAIEKIPKAGDGGIATARKLSDAFDQLGQKAKISSAALSDFEASMKVVQDSGAALNNSLAPSSLESKFGQSIIKGALGLSKVLEDPINSIAELNKLLTNSAQLSLFDAADVETLVAYKKELEDIGTADKAILEGSKKGAEQLTNALNERVKLDKKLSVTSGKYADNSIIRQEVDTSNKAIADARAIVSKFSAIEATNNAKRVEITNKLGGMVLTSFEKGSRLIEASFNAAFARGMIEIGNAKLSGLSGPGLSQEQTKLKMQEFSVQRGLVEAVYQNTLETITNSAILERANLKDKAQNKDKKLSGSEIANINKSIESLDKLINVSLPGIRSGKIPRQAIKDSITAEVVAGNAGSASALQGVQIATTGRSEKMAGINAGITAANIQDQKAQAQEVVALATKRADLQASYNTQLNNQLELQTQFSGLYSADNQRQINTNELNAVAVKQAAALFAENSKLADIKNSTKNLKMAQAQQEVVTALMQQQEIEKEILKIKQAVSLVAKKDPYDILVKQQANELLSILDEQAQAYADIAQARISSAQALGTIDESSAITQKAALDRLKIELEYQAKLRDIEVSKMQALTGVNQQRAANTKADGTTVNTAEASNLEKEEARIKSLYSAKKSAIDLVNNSQKLGLEISTQQALQLEKEAATLKTITSIAEGLATTFGDMGAALGQVVKITTLYLDKQSKLNSKLDNARKVQEQATAMGESGAKEQLVIDKLNLENTLLKVDAVGEYAGAAKMAFKQDSAQYKALEMAQKAAALVSTGAAIAKLVSQSGWFGFAGAAALVALMASYGITGGSSGMPAGGFDAEAQQKVQGTGQSYGADGKLFSNGGGVMGDDKATAKSIDDSISQIEKFSFKTLEYSNKMLDSLRSIKTNTDGLTAAILQAGINVNNLDATGTVKVGTTKAATEDRVGLIKNSLTLIGGSDNVIGRAINKLSNTIFGGGTNTTVEDTGIQVSGLIRLIATSAEGLVQQYTNIKTVTSGGWFKSDKVNLSQQFANLADPVNTALEGIFSGIVSTVTEASDALGKDPTLTKSLIDSFNVVFKISAQGLDAEGLANAINAQIGVTFNQLASKVFPELDKFRLAGEEMGTAVVRLARDIQVTTLVLSSIGMAFKDVADLVERVGITESLIELSGGLDTFVSQAEFFKTTFLSSAEQLAPVQAALIAELDRIGNKFNVVGLSAMTTREQFAKTVTALDLTTEAGQRMYVDLQNVAEAFSLVYEETRKIATASEILQSKLQQQIDIYTLEGRSSAALTLQRQDELSQMDERLRSGQLYIYALQDEAQLKGELRTAYTNESTALKNTISTLKTSVKTLNDYRAALSAGAQSNLSPQQKYSAAKEQAMQVAGLATGILASDATEAQKQAKQDAINQLPAVSSAFLDASRLMYSSSAMYNEDFSYIQALLDSTSSALTNQESAAQQQLDRLDTQVGALISIKDSTETTKLLMGRLVLAQENTLNAQTGTIGTGLIVGGPVLNDPTNIETLFKDLVQKIADLSAEVSGLRADQQVQTQDIITTNVRTTQVAAAVVADRVETVASGSQWNRDMLVMLN